MMRVRLLTEYEQAWAPSTRPFGDVVGGQSKETAIRVRPMDGVMRADIRSVRISDPTFMEY